MRINFKLLKKLGYVITLPAVATVVVFLWSKQSEVYKERISFLKEKNANLSEEVESMRQMYETLSYSRSLEELTAQKQLYESKITSLSGELLSVEERLGMLQISSSEKEELLKSKEDLLKKKAETILGYQTILAMLSASVEEELNRVDNQNAVIEEAKSEPESSSSHNDQNSQLPQSLETDLRNRYLSAALDHGGSYLYEGLFADGLLKIYLCWYTKGDEQVDYIDCGTSFDPSRGPNTPDLASAMPSASELFNLFDRNETYIISASGDSNSALLSVVKLAKFNEESIYTLRFEDRSTSWADTHSIVMRSISGDVVHLPNFDISQRFGW